MGFVIRRLKLWDMKNVVKIESVKSGTKFQLPPWGIEGAILFRAKHAREHRKCEGLRI
jgi:hypothetical protein